MCHLCRLCHLSHSYYFCIYSMKICCAVCACTFKVCASYAVCAGTFWNMMAYFNTLTCVFWFLPAEGLLSRRRRRPRRGAARRPSAAVRKKTWQRPCRSLGVDLDHLSNPFEHPCLPRSGVGGRDKPFGLRAGTQKDDLLQSKIRSSH